MPNAQIWAGYRSFQQRKPSACNQKGFGLINFQQGFNECYNDSSKNLWVVKRVPDTSKRAANECISHPDSNASDEIHFQEEKCVPMFLREKRHNTEKPYSNKKLEI